MYIFIDRDGVINKNNQSDVDGPFYVTSPAHLEYRPSALYALRKLHEANIPVYIITSQAWVSLRPELAMPILDKIHEKLLHDVRLAGGDIAGVGVITNQRESKVSLIRRFVGEADLSDSYVIGDSASDIKVGKAVGCSTIFIKNAFAESEVSDADYVVEDLGRAVDIILGGLAYRRLLAQQEDCNDWERRSFNE